MMKSIRPEAIPDNVFKLIGKDWMLVSACTTREDEEGNIITGRPNTMTASWGGMGVMWNKNVATLYIRPSRYTKELLDASDCFSLSILPDKYRTALNYCGSHSGRDGDKFREAKLKVNYMNNVPWVDEARLVIFCRKLYSQEISPYGFVEEKLCKQNYKNDDFHTMYIGEIEKVIIDQRELK